MFLILAAAECVRTNQSGDVTVETVLTGPKFVTALKMNIVETAVTRVLRPMKAVTYTLTTRNPVLSVLEERDT